MLAYFCALHKKAVDEWLKHAYIVNCAMQKCAAKPMGLNCRFCGIASFRVEYFYFFNGPDSLPRSSELIKGLKI